MVVVTIGYRELKTAILHRGGIHGYRSVGHTCIGRNGNAKQQILRLVLIPLSRKLDTVVEECQVDTNVSGLLFLPSDELIHISRDGRTGDRLVTEAISHVITHHSCLIHVLTDVLITEFTIAGANLEHVYDVAVDGEEILLIETPTNRD